MEEKQKQENDFVRGKKHTGRWRHNSKAGVPERAAETHAALRRGGEVCTQPAPHACWNVPDPCGQQAARGLGTAAGLPQAGPGVR